MKQTVNSKAKKNTDRVRRDPEGTRRRLLEAGCALFSQRGYHGVAVDDIVAEAGCNKRMLYHYYGNKDGLYTEVLRSVFRKLEEYELETTKGELMIGDAITNLLTRYFEFLEANPEFTRLLMWENLHNGQFLDTHPELLSKSPILQRMEFILQQGREQGEIGTQADSRHLLVLLIGLCSIHFSNQHTLKHSTGLNLTQSKVRRKGLDLAKEIVLKGIFA